MGEGVGFADALAHVQAEGYAEADPSHDIDGHDAAAKTAALANVLMDAGHHPRRRAQRQHPRRDGAAAARHAARAGRGGCA